MFEKILAIMILISSSHLKLIDCVLFIWIRRGTLVVGDSRCCSLVGPLSDEGIRCFAFRGAGVRTISHEADRLIRMYNPVACLLMCGINDATILNKRNRVIRPRFEDSFDLANYIIGLILQTRRELSDHHPDTRLIIGGIVGVSLNSYNKLPGISPMQYIIDDMITQVNSYVRLLNQLALVSPPRLTSKVHCWRKGKRKNYYHLLRDGLHPGPLLRETWMREITGFHYRNSVNASLCMTPGERATVSKHS